MEIDKIYNMDCLEGMKQIPDGSIDAKSYNPLEGIIAKGFHELVKRENDGIEKILRVYIDRPISGEITKEKVKFSGVTGLIKRKDIPFPKMEQTENGFRYTIESPILGLSQGDILITPSGKRIPLDAIPCEWYEERFVFE